MSIFYERLEDIIRHQNVHISFNVVPLEGEASVEVAVPVGVDSMDFFEGTNKVVGVGFQEVLSTKEVKT